MTTLRLFLESAPKPLLKAIHASFRESKGLLSNARLLPEVLESVSQPERFQAYYDDALPWQQRCLRWIYASGQRGMDSRELMQGLDSEAREDLGTFLGEGAAKLFFYRRRGDTQMRWCGFLDFTSHALTRTPTEPPASPGLNHGPLLGNHLQFLASRLFLGKGRLTTSGELHKRFSASLEESLTFSKQLSSAVVSDEITLLMAYLQDGDFLLQNTAGELRLSPSYLQAISEPTTPSTPNSKGVIHWWMRKRLGGDRPRIRHALELCPCPIGVWADYWWASEPVQTPPRASHLPISYESLPRVARDPWLLGLVQFHLANGRIQSVTRTPAGDALLGTDPLHSNYSSPTFTPNMEWVVPLPAPAQQLFLAHTLGEAVNDELWMRFRLRKDLFLEGLAAGLPNAWVDELLQSAGSLNSVLSEWVQSHRGAEVSTERVLHIQNPVTWKELSEFPLFQETIKTALPGWGFLLHPHKEALARELLLHFGLQPPPERDVAPLTPLPLADWLRIYHPAIFGGSPEYDLAQSPLTSAPPLPGGSKYSHDFQKMDLGHLTQVLRYAMVTDSLLEAEVNKGATPLLQFRVERLQLRKEPYCVAIITADNTARELDLVQIERLRLVST